MSCFWNHFVKLFIDCATIFSSRLRLTTRISYYLRATAVVGVEALAPKTYSMVILASASTLSGSVVRTLRSGEGLPKMFCLVALSMGHLRSQCSIVFAKGTQGVCGGVEEIGLVADPL